MSDWRLAARMLWKERGVSFIAVVTIGLGIGLSTGMFSILSGALLRGLPFPSPHRILHIGLYDVGRDRGAELPSEAYQWLVTHQQSFDPLGAFFHLPANLAAPARTPERYLAARMTPSVFQLLQAQPAMGRVFVAAEGRPGALPTVIIGHRVWQQEFGGVPDVIGRSIRVNGVTSTVVAVMPPAFRFPYNHDLWLPLVLNPDAAGAAGGPPLEVVGRLKPALSIAQARAEAATLSSLLRGEQSAVFTAQRLRVRPFVEDYFGSTADMIYTMFAAAIGVLLLACLNVAGLLLSRSVDRSRDIVVRATIGAGKWRLARQALAEVSLLTVVGSLLGVMIARLAVVLFNRAMALTWPPFWMDVRIDGLELAFVLAATAVSALLAGFGPALHTATFDLSSALKEGGRSTTGRGAGRFGRGLVVAEMAIACGLAVSSGLITRGIVKASNVDFGLAMDDVWTARLAFPVRDYPDDSSRREALDHVLDRLAAISGARSVSASTSIPTAGSSPTRVPLMIEGREYGREGPFELTQTLTVSSALFETFRVQMVEGRSFDTLDRVDAPPAAIVNQAFARKYFPDGVIGKRLAAASGTDRQWRTVVGVVPDLGIGQMATDGMRDAVYIPASQVAATAWNLFVRTDGAPLELTAAARAVVRNIDPNLPIFLPGTVKSTVLEYTWPLRIFGFVFVPFGLAALILASIGLYGVVAGSVSRRTQEIGVRMTCGAQRGQVLGMVLRGGLAPVLVGVAPGLGLAVALGRSLEFLMFGIDPHDPAIFAVTTGTLFLSAVAACLIPALRAARMDPLRALRHD